MRAFTRAVTPLAVAAATLGACTDSNRIDTYKFVPGAAEGVFQATVNHTTGNVVTSSPSRGISGNICAVNYFETDSTVTEAEARRAAENSLADISKVNEQYIREVERGIRENYSGRSKAEFTAATKGIAADLPRQLDQTLYRGDRSGMTACYQFAAEYSQGRPTVVYGITGSQAGIVTQDHHTRGIYNDLPLGQEVGFSTVGMRFTPAH